MTVKDLYAMCENLNQSTRFTIREGYLEKTVLLDEPYTALAQYWETPVKGFRIVDRLHCDIYI